MISVPNHRRPLSGNNKIYLIAYFSVLLSSCALLQGNKPVSDIGEPDTKKEVIKRPNPSEFKEVPNEVLKPSETVYFHGEEFQVPLRKKNYEIVLILPFGLTEANPVENRLTNIISSYYQGVRCALSQREDGDFSFVLRVYDNGSDSSALIRILNKPELKKADAIIGPLGDEALTKVSAFAIKYGIPVFSPFSTLNASNPKFYNLNTDLKSKAVHLAEFVKKQHPGSKLYIVRDNKPFDKEFVPILIAELEKQKIPYNKVAFTNLNNWNVLLNNEKNLIYVPSVEKNVVSVTLGNIFATKKPVTVIGDYKWTDLLNNDFRHWENLNVHLLAGSYIDWSDSTLVDFRMLHRSLYVLDPDEYACTGYFQTSFVLDCLSTFGNAFPDFIVNKKLLYGSWAFHFSSDRGSKFNRHAWMLKYQDHRLIPVLDE